MEDWKEFDFFFVKKEPLSINTSIVSCVYNLKHTHIIFSDLWCKFFIRAVCIVYVCSVLTCSIITSLENVIYIVS